MFLSLAEPAETQSAEFIISFSFQNSIPSGRCCVVPVHDHISSLLMREILCHAVAESFSFAGLSAANEKDQFLCDLCVSSDPDQSGERAVNSGSIQNA